jgi:hypothetical protein
MDLAKSICAKYGFGCTYINSTFGGDDAVFVVYLKTKVNADEYKALRKAYDRNNRESMERFWAVGEGYENTYLEMHKCVNELDEQTALMFDYGWHGNCGLFGSHDVKRQSYSGGDSLTSWESILDRWNSSIHDTLSRLSKGVYVMMYTHYIKPEAEDSPILDDTMEQALLDAVRKELSDKYVANYEMGKRQYDKESYKALIVRYKDGNDYSCMIRFSRDWIGRYIIYSAAPLCGESNWVMDWKNPINDIREALGRRVK